MNFPEDLKYSKDHAWLRQDGDFAYIGITDHAQSELGDIVYVDAEESDGESFDKDEVYGSVEAVKTVSDLFIPISAEVVEFNEAVDDNPELINSAPYEAWIVKINIKDAKELDALLSAVDYKALIGA